MQITIFDSIKYCLQYLYYIFYHCTETGYQSACTEISDLRRQKALVQTYSHQTNDTIKHYDEYSRKITGQADKLVNKAK